MPGDPVEEVRGRAVQGTALREVALIPGVVRVDHAVQDHGTDALRVEGGVDGAEVASVGVPQVVDLVEAEGDPDGVHVVRAVLGAHVVQERTGVIGTGLGVGFGVGAQCLLLGGVGRDGVLADGGEEAGVAADRGDGGTHAARVEGDHVVGLTEFLGHPVVGVGGPHASRAARSAGVDQHGVLGGPGGGDPGERDLDCLGEVLGPLTVGGACHGDGDGGALEVLAVDRVEVRTGLPAEGLLVYAGGRCGLDRAGGRLGRHRCGVRRRDGHKGGKQDPGGDGRPMRAGTRSHSSTPDAGPVALMHSHGYGA